MGGVLASLFGEREARLLMVGLDAAGKTTVLYRLKLGEVVTTIPTIGFNVETIEYKHITFTVWDVGGRDKGRLLWRHYYERTRGLIFVVDSNDRERMGDGNTTHGQEWGSTARDELTRLTEEPELAGVPVLVLANKQDMPGALSPEEVAQRLGVHEVCRNRAVHVQGATATTGDGLYEGLEWLSLQTGAKASRGFLGRAWDAVRFRREPAADSSS